MARDGLLQEPAVYPVQTDEMGVPTGFRLIVIAQVPPPHLHRFVTALYTGLRKGELRNPEGIDWSLKAIRVRWSGVRDTTKTKGCP